MDDIMAKAKYKQGADGFWRTKIWDGSYNPDGSKHRVNLSSKKSSGDLEKQVNALKAKVANGQVIQDTDMTFLAYARHWRKTYKQIREDNTQAMYDNVIEKHLIVLDGLKLRDVKKSHLQLVINTASEKPRTCQQIALTFKQIITAAIQDKHMPPTAFNDICVGFDMPKYKPTEKRALYPAEVAAMKAADLSPMERCFVYIIYGCGLRRGEVLALNKDLHVNLKTRELTVNTAVRFKDNQPGTKAPKSQNGYRKVPMPAFLVDFLSGYIPTLAAPYLIHNQDGSMMTKSGYDKMWGRIKRKMNIAAGGTDKLHVIYGFTAHTFRHNYCTNLCYQIPKISIAKIAQLMGDTEAMVLKVYNHIKDEKENVEEVVADAVGF